MNLATQSHAAILASFEALAEYVDGGYTHRAPGVVTIVCGVDHPGFNAACAQTKAVGRAAVDDEIQRLETSGHPYSVLLPGEASAAQAASFAAAGLTREDPIPVMTAVEPSGVGWPDDLTIDTGAEAITRHRQLLVDVFAMSHAVVDPVVSGPLWDDEEVFTVVGLDGEVTVTTALAIRVGDGTGVFNVGTHPDYRGRGYGAAATAAVTDQAFAAGAKFATLQSSEMGISVYESLGFKHLMDHERWSVPTDV